MNIILILLGWTGSALLIAGTVLIGSRNRNAFLCFIAGELCWIIKGTCLHLPDLVLLSVVFAGLAVRNYVKWGAI